MSSRYEVNVFKLIYLQNLLRMHMTSLRESWTKGSSGVRPVTHWAGLMGCEDMKAEDYTHVQIGLYLAWKAGLATNYEDSFLCNRLHVTLDLSGVYINRRA